MISVLSLITLFQQAFNEKWGYIWGASGQMWTAAKQNAATREMTVKYGKKWIGHYVADCSGLFTWAFKKSGGYMYHGSNTIWNKYCTAQGKLSGGKRSDGQPIKPGTAVFLYRASDNNRHHIGLYIGNDTVIEAKGTQYGVVTSKLSHWDEWGELKGVNYDDTTGDAGGTQTMTLLKNGSRGDAVSALQETLNKIGFDCGNVDGIFGTKTENAVRAFQTAKGLNVDGIAGKDTLDALAIAVSTGGGNLGTDTDTDNTVIDDDDPMSTNEGAVTITQAQYDAMKTAYSALKTALGV